MLDLGELEKRLNKDSELQKKFLKNPVKFLADEGLKLSTQMAKRLRASMSKMKGKKAPAMGKMWHLICTAAEESVKKSK